MGREREGTRTAGDPAGKWLGVTRRCLLGNLGLAASAALLGVAREALSKLGQLVEVLVCDTQSNPNRAATVADELIKVGVSLMLVSSTPETTNPVSIRLRRP